MTRGKSVLYVIAEVRYVSYGLRGTELRGTNHGSQTNNMSSIKSTLLSLATPSVQDVANNAKWMDTARSVIAFVPGLAGRLTAAQPSELVGLALALPTFLRISPRHYPAVARDSLRAFVAEHVSSGVFDMAVSMAASGHFSLPVELKLKGDTALDLVMSLGSVYVRSGAKRSRDERDSEEGDSLMERAHTKFIPYDFQFRKSAVEAKRRTLGPVSGRMLSLFLVHCTPYIERTARDALAMLDYLELESLRDRAGVSDLIATCQRVKLAQCVMDTAEAQGGTSEDDVGGVSAGIMCAYHYFYRCTGGEAGDLIHGLYSRAVAEVEAEDEMDCAASVVSATDRID